MVLMGALLVGCTSRTGDKGPPEGTRAHDEGLPEVTLARVEAAPVRTQAPGVILTAALRAAAPGCAWTQVVVANDAPWSIVAPALAALYAEFGEVRTLFYPFDEPPLPGLACASVLPVSALTPAAGDTGRLQLRRRTCSE